MDSYQIVFIKNIATFTIGCCFGSFINVVIYRLPIGESIIFPSSHCIKCKAKIPWHEKIPLISWLFLKGKCSNCNVKISIIYPIVELTSGLLFVLNNYSYNVLMVENWKIPTIIFGWFLISILVILAILDVKYFWLPDAICSVGILTGLSYSLIAGSIYEDSNIVNLILESVIATLLGYLFFRMISAIGWRLYKKPAMGKGDAKLAALLGSWLGIKGLGIATWLAFYMAGIFVIIGLISKQIKRNQKIPFGTFLALSGISVWLLGNSTFSQIIFRYT